MQHSREHGFSGSIDL